MRRLQFLGDALSQAWTGVADAGFATKLDNCEGVAAIYPNYVQIVAVLVGNQDLGRS